MEFESGLFVFAVMIIVGSVCGFLYDLVRALEKPLRPRGALAVFSDLLFWLVVACLVSAAVLLLAGGQLRLVFLVAAVLGALLYFAGLSPWLFPPMCAVMMGLHRTLVRGIQQVLYAVGLPFRGVEAALEAVVGRMKPLAGRLSLAGLFSGAKKRE